VQRLFAALQRRRATPQIFTVFPHILLQLSRGDFIKFIKFIKRLIVISFHISSLGQTMYQRRFVGDSSALCPLCRKRFDYRGGVASLTNNPYALHIAQQKGASASTELQVFLFTSLFCFLLFHFH